MMAASVSSGGKPCAQRRAGSSRPVTPLLTESVQASAPPPADVLDLLARHKAAIVKLLHLESDPVRCRSERCEVGGLCNGTQLPMIPEDETELLAALDRAAQMRRLRVLEMLAANPAVRFAVVCDGSGDPVPVAIAIRDKGTCEVLIPANKFDPFGLLELIDRHSGTLH